MTVTTIPVDGIILVDGTDEVLMVTEKGDPGAKGDAGAGVDELTALITSETARATDAEDAIVAMLDSEVAALESADTDEAADRSAQDNALQDAIDAANTARVAAEAALAAATLAGDNANAALVAAEAATRAAHDLLLTPLALLGVPNGVAQLGSDGKLVPGQNNSTAITSRQVFHDEATMLAWAAQEGDVAIRDDIHRTFILGAGNPALIGSWAALETPLDAVSSVNTRVGDVVGLAEQADLTNEVTARTTGDATNAAAVTAEAVARAAADTAEATTRGAAITTLTTNLTAEAATRLAADNAESIARANADTTNSTAIGAETTRALAAEGLLQLRSEKNQASGYVGLDAGSVVPDIYIAASIARDTEVATAVAAEAVARDAAIATAVANLLASAPGALDTLKELADALGDDPNFAATVNASIATKLTSTATVAAFAGLVLAADKLPYGTGPGAMALTTLTTWARTFLASVTAADGRTALGLGTAATHASTDYDLAGAAAAAAAASQPLATTLSAFVALTSAADKLGYFTGIGTMSTTDLTTLGRTLIGQTTVGGARTALGLGTVATLNSGVANAGDVPLRSDGDTRYGLKTQQHQLLYGDGSDGAYTLDGTTTPAWAAKTGGAGAWVYTLLRPIFMTDLTIAAGTTVKNVGYPILGTGTLTITGAINCDGAFAAAGVGGGNGASGTFLGGSKGGNGGAVGSGAGAAGTALTSRGGAGGAGGAGLGAAGAAGVVTAIPASYSGSHQMISFMLHAWWNPQAGGVTMAGGTGGGGGGGSTLAVGGGAGAGGGVIAIEFRNIVNNGTVSANGGNGANAAASVTNGGGGGAGGGGYIVTLSDAAWSGAGTWTVTKGTPGNGVNAGVNGAAGNDGAIEHTLAAA